MSRTQKRALFLLALIALLFVALLLWGGLRPPCSDCNAHDYKAGPAMKALGALSDDWRPAMKLRQERYQLAQGGQLSEPLGPLEDGDELRRLKLERLQGTIALSVEVRRGPNDPDLGEQAKPTMLPRDHNDPDQKMRLTYAVTPLGGQLKMLCVTGPCVLQVR
jgi:hypothetical protein